MLVVIGNKDGKMQLRKVRIIEQSELFIAFDGDGEICIMALEETTAQTERGKKFLLRGLSEVPEGIEGKPAKQLRFESLQVSIPNIHIPEHREWGGGTVWLSGLLRLEFERSELAIVGDAAVRTLTIAADARYNLHFK
jgi:hypothetical protein